MARHSSQENDDKLKYRIELTNQVFQIIAIFIAGLWALWTWVKATEPSLKTGVSLTLEASSEWKETSLACIGYAKVNIENIGQQIVSVDKVKYELRTANAVILNNKEEIKDIGTLPETTELLKEGDFGDKFLTGDYSPKVKMTQTLSILFSPEIKKDLWVYVTAYDSNNKVIDYWYDMLPSCKKEEKTLTTGRSYKPHFSRKYTRKNKELNCRTL